MFRKFALLMQNCTYSKDPKIKKKKKYLDGFVKAKDMTVTLFDENKKVLYKTKKYAITDDETLNMGFFTVIIDDFMFLQNNEPDRPNCDDEMFIKTCDDSETYDCKKPDMKKAHKSVSVHSVERIRGRENIEILNIFKNAKNMFE